MKGKTGARSFALLSLRPPHSTTTAPALVALAGVDGMVAGRWMWQWLSMRLSYGFELHFQQENLFKVSCTS